MANDVRLAGSHAPRVPGASRSALARQLRCAGPGDFSATLRAGEDSRVSRGCGDEREHAFDLGSLMVGARRTDELAGAACVTAAETRTRLRTVRIEAQRHARDGARPRFELEAAVAKLVA